MGVKTFNDGDVLTASDVNTYLMNQAVIVCTSGTRPSSPTEGMTIAETDTDRILTYDGTDWRVTGYYGDGESYTPTITSNGTNPTMGTVTSLGRYWQRGTRRIDVLIWIKIGAGWAAGTGSYAVSLPVAVNSTYNRHSLSFTFYDSSAPNYYRGFAHAGEGASIGSTDLSAAKLYYHVAAADSYAGFTASAPVAPALNDIFEICGSYYG